jgi:uncharacterized OB-fold protein
MKEKPETCVWCGGTDVVPRGKEMYKGRKVNMAECKRCGIIFVSTERICPKSRVCSQSPTPIKYRYRIFLSDLS